MFIHEATSIAAEVNGYMFRPQHPDWLLRPANSRECIQVITRRHPEPRPRWNPTAEDLTANDWCVTRGGMI